MITFKDAANLRSPQQHTGVIHSSNLCTEITLNTQAEREIAVCNLGSVNLANHLEESGINSEKLKKTIDLAMRMLDNVIDYNYYSVNTARASKPQTPSCRARGNGLSGCPSLLNIPYASEEAIEFADSSAEEISYYAISASSDLAAERGAYQSFNGSLWSGHITNRLY